MGKSVVVLVFVHSAITLCNLLMLSFLLSYLNDLLLQVIILILVLFILQTRFFDSLLKFLLYLFVGDCRLFDAFFNTQLTWILTFFDRFFTLRLVLFWRLSFRFRLFFFLLKCLKFRKCFMLQRLSYWLADF